MHSNGAAFSPAEGLGVVLDLHLRWIGQWHRAIFYRYGEGVDEDGPPSSFARWLADAKQDDLAHQPAVEKLIALHEQMHRQARFLRLKAETGDYPTETEYEGVIARFDEFCLQLRRVERAFGAAQSALDPLTGLRHRRGMDEALEREENRFRRTGQPYCVAIGDIDKFKSVNDTYGHDVGDKVIAAFAAVISRSIRNFDEAFRMGGEEFLICLKETDLNDGFAVIDRLRQTMEKTALPLPDGKSFSVTASFGIAQAHGDFTPDVLVKQADKALYQSKNNGRNQVTRYPQPKKAAPAPGVPAANGRPTRTAPPRTDMLRTDAPDDDYARPASPRPAQPGRAAAPRNDVSHAGVSHTGVSHTGVSHTGALRTDALRTDASSLRPGAPRTNAQATPAGGQARPAPPEPPAAPTTPPRRRTV